MRDALRLATPLASLLLLTAPALAETGPDEPAPGPYLTVVMPE